MSAITLKVNGQNHTLDLDPSTPLLYALSDDLALRGPKFGCGLGQCGACTAIVNGTAMRSCVTPVSAVAGAERKCTHLALPSLRASASVLLRGR